MGSIRCQKCGRLPHFGECIGEVASNCSAADAEQLAAQALAEDLKRSADMSGLASLSEENLSRLLCAMSKELQRRQRK